MSIVDALIIVFFILGIISGLRRGLLKEVVLLVGIVLSIVISFYLRTPIATFFYKTLPFFSFKGVYSGVTILNILLYEMIAFLIVFSILYLILRVILKITGFIELLLKLTIILGIFSKIGGAIVGFIEAYVLIFVFLFIFSQPFLNIKGLNESRVANRILDSTPVMSNSIRNTRQAINEVYNLSKIYKTDKKEFNDETIKLFIKYDIITEENIEILKERGKLE